MVSYFTAKRLAEIHKPAYTVKLSMNAGVMIAYDYNVSIRSPTDKMAFTMAEHHLLVRSMLPTEFISYLNQRPDRAENVRPGPLICRPIQ